MRVRKKISHWTSCQGLVLLVWPCAKVRVLGITPGSSRLESAIKLGLMGGVIFRGNKILLIKIVFLEKRIMIHWKRGKITMICLVISTSRSMRSVLTRRYNIFCVCGKKPIELNIFFISTTQSRLLIQHIYLNSILVNRPYRRNLRLWRSDKNGCTKLLPSYYEQKLRVSPLSNNPDYFAKIILQT